MKRILFITLITAAFLLLLSVAAQAQGQSAVEGTWIGEASTDDSSAKFILEIASENGVLSGTIRPDPGAASKVFDLEDLEFKDGKLFFDYSKTEGLADMTQVELKLEGGQLIGIWHNSDGESGAIKFTRRGNGPPPLSATPRPEFGERPGPDRLRLAS